LATVKPVIGLKGRRLFGIIRAKQPPYPLHGIGQAAHFKRKEIPLKQRRFFLPKSSTVEMDDIPVERRSLLS
jgi:hypothetical protein